MCNSGLIIKKPALQHASLLPQAPMVFLFSKGWTCNCVCVTAQVHSDRRYLNIKGSVEAHHCLPSISERQLWLVEREREREQTATNTEPVLLGTARTTLGCTQVLNYLTKDVKHGETKTDSAVKCWQKLDFWYIKHGWNCKRNGRTSRDRRHRE